MAFDQQDQELIGQLRSKYSNHCATAAEVHGRLSSNNQLLLRRYGSAIAARAAGLKSNSMNTGDLRTLSRDQRQLKKLREKIEDLQQERSDLLAKVATSRSAEERALQENLLEHITLHVEHLQGVFREKQAACGSGC
eukprot:gene11170-11320_t